MFLPCEQPTAAGSGSMKTILARLLGVVERLGSLAAFPGEIIRRTFMSSEARQREAMEAERLDRIRNPRDYEGK